MAGATGDLELVPPVGMDGKRTPPSRRALPVVMVAREAQLLVTIEAAAAVVVPAATELMA
jgi:hypothetical protein